jgi:hypothetical protein
MNLWKQTVKEVTASYAPWWLVAFLKIIYTPCYVQRTEKEIQWKQYQMIEFHKPTTCTLCACSWLVKFYTYENARFE